MQKDNVRVVRKIFMIITTILLLIIFFSLLFLTKDNKLIKDIKEYIKKDTKVIYIANKKNYDNYPIDIFKKYDINYMYINSTNLSKFEKSKLEKIINSKYLSNIIVVFKDGKVLDAIIEYEDEKHLNSFLQKNELIPEIIEDNKNIIPSVNKLLKTNLSIIYLPYKNSDIIEKQDKILKEISEEYNINYKMVKAYLLSNNQQEKLNSILQISSVEEQIIILVKDEKIVGSIREIENKKTYLNKLESYNFIDEIDSYITYINYSKFKDLLNNSSKNIITIGKDECKYCDNTIKILNTIAINNDIDINYINIGSIDSDLAHDVEKNLINLGYKDGFTTPLTIIVENNKLLDYVIGASIEEYFVDVFKENGIIK